MSSRITLKHVLSLAMLPLAFGVMRSLGSGTQEAPVVPPPLKDEVAGARTTAVAILAGGCFWGVQGVYQHINGVLSAVSGYAGGDKSTAEYELVVTGRTGHAESVRITYDPRVISYGRLLQVFFSVVHDPTQLNRQGPDFGPQYRSTIFPVDAEQAGIARAYVAQLEQTKLFDAAIATTVEVDRQFYEAEAYHQDFMVRNPQHPYIEINDAPKVENLKRLFASIYSAKPKLVNAR